MTQRYRGSDFQVPVGSFPDAGQLDSADTGTILGFRLVHDGADRVLRGGGWDDDPQSARVVNRGDLDPGGRTPYRGFRLTREDT